MPLPSPTNPIAYAQFHLNGGWKINSIVSGAVLAVLAMLIYATGIDRGVFHPQAVAGWALGMQVIALLILLIYGSFRVEAAVRSDVASRMIDSHRLMPSPAISAVISYILLAPLTAISLATALILTGLGCALVGGLDSGTYMVGSCLIFIFSIFVWSIVARFAFDTRGGFLLALLVGAVLVVGQASLTTLMPGVSVLTCPVLGNPAYSYPGRASMPLTEYAAAVGGQIAVTVICVIASARRFRSEEAVGFTPVLGLALLGIWIGLSMLGMKEGLHFSMSRIFSRHEDGFTPEKFTSSVAAAMLLAVMPLAAAARQSARWIRRGPTPSMPRKPPSIFLVGAVAAIFMLILLAAPDGALDQSTYTTVANNIVFTALSISFYVIAVGCLFEWFYLAADKAVVLTIAWLVVTWAVPAVFAGIINATSENSKMTSMALCISPIGLIAQVWNGNAEGEVFGLIAQAAVTVLPVTLLVLRRGRINHRRGPGFPVLPAN